MTTEATENPQAPQPPVMDVAEVYRTLGRLEEAQAQNRESLVRIEQRIDRLEERNGQRFDQQEERNEQRFRDVSRRIDRLWYTIVGIGAALAVGYILDRVLGGG